MIRVRLITLVSLISAASALADTVPRLDRISAALTSPAEATITGASQAVPGQAAVICLNMETGWYAVTQAAVDGSFETRLFATPGAWILVGRLPFSRRCQGLVTGLSEWPCARYLRAGVHRMASRDATHNRDVLTCEDPTRRELLRTLVAIGAAPLLWSLRAEAQQGGALLTRTIPSSSEALPVVGLGSWITFNVGNDRGLRDECTEVIRVFLESGGRLIDSSPMYGSSQSVIGYALAKLKRPSQLFAADKVWIADGGQGASQIEESRRHWGVKRFDLVQVHNLLSWEKHLQTLFAMKREGRVRYVGITTSEGRRHDEFEKIMRSQPLDFIQVSYNPIDRDAERRILPLARDRGMAVIVNRPFQQGSLTRRLARHPLPGWAAGAGARSWAQLILKFIVSHPAVTCAIPATSSAAHARENMAAARGVLPDETMRRRIAETIGRL